jgi:NitT/TauT family transport system substrate-binding protein
MRLGFVSACVVLTGILGLAPQPPLQAQSLPVIRVPILASGITSVLQVVSNERHLDRAHGFQFKTSAPYESLDAYYADFLAGQFDVEGGISESYAVRFLRGAPVQLMATLVSAGASLLAKDPAISTVAALRGRTLAAPLTSGRYVILRGLLLKYYGFDLERDAKVIGVPNPSAGITFVLAGRADAALSWEPIVSSALLQNPALRLVLDTRIEYRTRTGRELYQVVLAGQRDTIRGNPVLMRQVIAAYRDAAEFMQRDPDAAAILVAQHSDISRDAFLQAVRSRRIAFAVQSFTDPVARRAILDEFGILETLKFIPNGIPDEFFARF